MSQEEIGFLPFEVAKKIVAAIQEEEDIHNNDRRILTVYNQENKEVCWFDFEEVLAAVEQRKVKEEQMELVTDYILHHIPDWAVDI